MASDRILIVPEHLTVHKPLDTDPKWLRTPAFVGCVSVTSWPGGGAEPTEPSIHVLALDRNDAQSLVDELTLLLRGP